MGLIGFSLFLSATAFAHHDPSIDQFNGDPNMATSATGAGEFIGPNETAAALAKIPVPSTLVPNGNPDVYNCVCGKFRVQGSFVDTTQITPPKTIDTSHTGAVVK